MSRKCNILALVLLAIVTITLFISCSKDDDGFTVDGTNIEGTWVFSEEYKKYDGIKVSTYFTINSYGEICCYYTIAPTYFEIQDGYIINDGSKGKILFVTNIKDGSFYADYGYGMTMTAKVEVANKNTIKFIEHIKINSMGVNSVEDGIEELIRIKGVKEKSDDEDIVEPIPTKLPVIGGGENNGNGNNNNNGNDDNGSGNNGNNGNVDWTGNWQNVTDDFSKTISFRKIRVLNKQSNNVNYCCAFFSLNPNDNTTKDTYYNINFYNLTIGDNMSQGPNGIKISSCTPIGDNWYEYEFSNYLYFSHYQENTPRNQLWVLPQTETR